MNILGMLLSFIFLMPFFIGIVSIFFLRKISDKTNFLVDVPAGDALKIHQKNIPLVGGLAMAVSVLAGFLFTLGNSLTNSYELVSGQKSVSFQIVAILLGLAFVFLLGFWDDLKWKHVSTIKPLLKFFLLIVCTLIPSALLSWAGIKFNLFPVTIISLILGFGYIFVCINAVNYQDGMDGLAGGLAFISLAGFLYLGLWSGNFFAVAISLIFLGTVLSFLCFNFPPAKVFMGDSGAYSLGFILAVLAMLLSKPYNFYSILGPIFIIGLPIFDGVYTNIRRILAGKSIFLGDRSHFYDKLLQKGFSTKKTLAICYSSQIILVIAGILIYR